MRIHRHRHNKPKYKVPQYRVNEKITAEVVRVIDENNEMVGELPIDKAIALAQERELDLVEVSPKAEPPVCRILDHGQFKYQKEKEAKKQRALSKEIDLKGVRLTFRIGIGDRMTRLEQARKFLERGDKVKVELVLRGREKAHKEIAAVRVEEFIVDLKAFFPIRVEQKVTYQGGRMTAIVARE